jgi:hypothetical protein
LEKFAYPIPFCLAARMTPLSRLLVTLVAVSCLGAPAQAQAVKPDLSPWPATFHEEVSAIFRWPFNDRSRPLPPVVAALPAAEVVSTPPPGAIVLFDGKDLSSWQPSTWSLSGDHVEIRPGKDYLVTRAPFGSCRLHFEWWTPPGPDLKSGQNRGNSGVFFMGQYEVQILDSYQNITYADGQAGAVYGQHPPSANPARPPGEWQTYVIEFIRPIFAEDGRLVRPARITVDFNGVRVQEGSFVLGPTNPPGRRPYRAHSAALPLQLQNHREVVRFRNIWIVPIDD